MRAAYLKRAGADLARVEFIVHPTNRGWMRDSGPDFRAPARRAETAIVHFHFNAWAKYTIGRRTAACPETAARRLNKRCSTRSATASRSFIEGGGIEVNGRGTLLTTEECYLDPKSPGAQPRPGPAGDRRGAGTTTSA